MGMDDTLVRHLLGSTSEEEAQRLDEMSVADDDFAARLAAAEDDLVDAYVAAALPAGQRSRLESIYLASSAGRARIDFARALASRAHLRRERPGWHPALAAAAGLVIAAGGYLLLQSRSPAVALSSPAPSRAAAPAAVNAATTPATVPGRQEGAPGVLSFVLLPPMRSAADVPALVIPEEKRLVELRLETQGDGFAEYVATLQDAAGVRTLWRSARVKAEASASNPVVPIRIPGNLLTPRLHIVELRGIPAGGDAQIVGSYPFRVVLQ